VTQIQETWPRTTERVARNTAEEINRRIQRRMEASVAYFADHPEEIGQRLDELDREWDIERAIAANAASISLIGLSLGIGQSRRWLMLPFGVGAFLLQHALQGWCPPVPILRRLGFRTVSEIDQERYALRYLRGDFRGSPAAARSAGDRARQAIAATEG
jgi:hypothetical protein